MLQNVEDYRQGVPRRNCVSSGHVLRSRFLFDVEAGSAGEGDKAKLSPLLLEWPFVNMVLQHSSSYWKAELDLVSLDGAQDQAENSKFQLHV